MRKKRILVTGAFGLVGTDLIVELLKRYNSDAIIAVFHKTLGHNFNVKKEKGDVSNIEFLERIIKEHKITEIYHLAGILSVGKRERPAACMESKSSGIEKHFGFGCKI